MQCYGLGWVGSGTSVIEPAKMDLGFLNLSPSIALKQNPMTVFLTVN